MIKVDITGSKIISDVSLQPPIFLLFSKFSRDYIPFVVIKNILKRHFSINLYFLEKLKCAANFYTFLYFQLTLKAELDERTIHN